MNLNNLLEYTKNEDELNQFIDIIKDEVNVKEVAIRFERDNNIYEIKR
jgi:hypothetical protein